MKITYTLLLFQCRKLKRGENYEKMIQGGSVRLKVTEEATVYWGAFAMNHEASTTQRAQPLQTLFKAQILFRSWHCEQEGTRTVDNLRFIATFATLAAVKTSVRHGQTLVQSKRQSRQYHNENHVLLSIIHLRSYPIKKRTSQVSFSVESITKCDGK